MRHFLPAVAVMAVMGVEAQHVAPIMGWSSWNTYHVDISEQLIRRQADAMVRTGLMDAGYRYVNVDDGYFGGRDAGGRLMVHPERFPNGMKPVADYIHNLGLKAGLYSEAGNVTCGSIYDNDSLGIGSGMYGHEKEDAELFFHEWGYDFIKIDFCGGRRQNLDEKEQYGRICRAVSDAADGREVSVNICRWAFPGVWAADVARSWRISSDIRPRWSSVKHILEKNMYLSAFCHDGHYNDMDMLEVGRGLKPEEEDTHFAMWCIMSSPLLIGCDLETIPDRTLRLITNQELIALNQDPLGLQPGVVQRDGDCYVLVKDIITQRGPTRAVAFFNGSDREQHISVPLSALELGGNVKVRELVTRQNRADVTMTLEERVPAHGTRIFRLTAEKRLVPVVYEAENAMPTGYDDLDNRRLPVVFQYDENASGSMTVARLGGSRENRLVFNKVFSEKNGKHWLTVHYVPEANRRLEVTVNGVTQTVSALESQGTIAEVTLPVSLRMGMNTIELGNDNALTVDIDRICVTDNCAALPDRNGYGRLTVEGREAPMGLDELHPRFGWQIVSDRKNVMQKGYRLLVATSEQLCREGLADVWDSGCCNNGQSQWVEYGGPALEPDTRYFWRVITWTREGRSESDVQQWSTGLLSADNWQGYWIGFDSITPDVKMERHSRIAVRHLRKQFAVSKPLRRATAYVCGLGYYILDIDGRRVGDYLLAPAPTQYDKAVIYDTYDITDRLAGSQGSRQIDVQLAGGYFFSMTQNFETNVRSTYGMPKLLMNIVIEYEDGTKETIATDTTWQVAIDGPIRYANLYDGALTDYRQKPAEWMPAERVAAPCGILRGNSIGGVRSYATEYAEKLTETAPKRYILDFGTNNTGRIYLPSVKIARGDTVTVRYAETLDKEGGLYTENLRQAENTDRFIGDGNSQCLTTEFLWHGFRYAEVSGLSKSDVSRMRRQLMTDDLLSSASVDIIATDSILNRVLDNARRGILSNYKGIPMDCPQRDERMPWLGDRTMGCFGESYLTHNHTLYAKWLQDICDAQRSDGRISDVSPSYWRLYNQNITWPAALPFGMEMMRLHYGDERPMKKYSDNVRRFLECAKEKSGKDGLITYDRYGDWCVPPASLTEVHTKDAARLTDGALISSCYYYYICRMMGMDEEAQVTRDAINRTFLKDGCYANGTITANLLPLAMDIVPESDKMAVQQSFETRLKDNIDCGVIGISWLMRYLEKCGLGSKAYRIASTKEYPGWGYMVENGATTIWELWNGNTADPSMNSGNHVMMLGDLIPWVFESLAGIAPDPELPGFRHIIMRPDFSISELNGVNATYPSIYGDITSHWERKGGKVTWSVTIPANTTATIYLPNGKTRKVTSGQYMFQTSPC